MEGPIDAPSIGRFAFKQSSPALFIDLSCTEGVSTCSLDETRCHPNKTSFQTVEASFPCSLSKLLFSYNIKIAVKTTTISCLKPSCGDRGIHTKLGQSSPADVTSLVVQRSFSPRCQTVWSRSDATAYWLFLVILRVFCLVFLVLRFTDRTWSLYGLLNKSQIHSSGCKGLLRWLFHVLPT